MKQTLEERIFHAVNALLLTLICAVCVLPLIYCAASSLSSGAALASGRVFLWPVDFTPSAYRLLAASTNLPGYFANSMIVTGVGTALSLGATILCAYPLSKKYLWRRRTISFLMTFTMLFGGGMIPTFLLVKNLGLLGSYFSLWLTGLISTYNMMIMRSYFERLPSELDESAKIDGCGEWRLLLSIYLPLSKPCLATVGLFYAVSYWNMYQKVVLYIHDSSKHTLSVFIQQTIFELQQLNLDSVEASAVGASDIVSQSVRSAGVVILIIPMLIVYPLLQKYFVRGVTLGALKG